MELSGTTEALSSADEGWAQGEMAAQATWRKSSWSTYNGNCVEVAQFGGGLIGVRDTKDSSSGPVLVFTRESWWRFLNAVKDDLVPRS
jgi:hypothetical protein